MRTPQELRISAQQDTVVAEYDYAGESLIAVDFGQTHTDLDVDIVGDTAIVTTDGNQFDFELPRETNDVTVNNGILTIRG